MEPGKRLPQMLGGALPQVLLPPIATLSADAPHEPSALTHLGNRLAPGSSHVSTERLASTLQQQGAASPAVAEPSHKKQRRLVGAPLVIGQQQAVPVPSSQVSVASSAISGGLHNAYHPPAPSQLQGICSLVSAGPSPPAMGLQAYPGQHATFGSQQHDVLLQVPLASLQAIDGVGANVPGAQRMLPIFHHHTNASAAPVVSTAAPDQGALDGNSIIASAHVPHHLLSGHGLSHIGSDASSNDRGSSNSSTTTAGNQNSNSGSASDDDGSREQDDGPTSRRLARREYHKKIERKRRDRMRSLYDELRALTDAAELADKNGVLEGAIGLIQQLRQENSKLSQELSRCAGKPSAQEPPAATAQAQPDVSESSAKVEQVADADFAAVSKMATHVREREGKFPSAVL